MISLKLCHNHYFLLVLYRIQAGTELEYHMSGQNARGAGVVALLRLVVKISLVQFVNFDVFP